MSPRRWHLGALAALTTAFVVHHAGAEPASHRGGRPNVLFILVDDLGARDLGCYGSQFYETPHIDRLAADGARFIDASVAYPRCVPSRFAILTGKHPAKFQGSRDSVHIDPSRDVTFGQAFQDAGYDTFYCGKWHLGDGPSAPSHVGFATSVAAGGAGATRSHFAPYNTARGKGKGEKEFIVDLDDAPEGEYLADRLTQETMAFIESPRDKPFLAVLAHYAVHTPLEAKPELTSRYADKLKRAPLPSPTFEPESAGENLIVQNNPTYAAMIESVDEGVGRLLAQLDRLGITDNTIVVLASDHGGLSARGNNRSVATSNRPLRAGKGHLYEGGLRIPLIVRWPHHIDSGRVIEAPVLSMDLFPTLLGLAGLPSRPSDHTDGMNLARLLTEGIPPPERTFFWHNPAPRPTSTGDLFSSAIRSGPLKLIEFPQEKRVELYDLSNDLSESRDLAADRPADRDRLLQKLHAWKKTVDASEKPRERKNHAVVTTEDVPETRLPNVILILTDDLGYADLGCFGSRSIKSPHLDRMAAEGTCFTDFYVAQAVCTASRAGLLTGCYPNRIGMAGALNHTSPTGVHPQETLLSERLKARGYATAAFGKWHLGLHAPFWPTNRGFDVFFGIPYSNDNGPLHPVLRDIPPLPLYDGETVIETDPDQSRFTQRITQRATDFIAKHRDQPFFLYIPHIMPHVPIFASDAWQGTSGHGIYADVIQELDWSVGEILNAVSTHGLDDRTLVIFTSDNGPFLSYGTHAGSAAPFREGKLTCFEGGVRVPCIMRWPGHVPAGRSCDNLITTLDLFTTLAAICDAGPVTGKPLLKTDGLDLQSLVLGAPGATGRDVFWYYSGNELHAIREGDWKLHLPHDYLTVAAEPGRDGKPSNFANMKPQGIQESGVRGIASRHGYRVETIPLSLFNLADDPGETRNLIAAHPEIVERLMAHAVAARTELGDSITGASGREIRPVGNIRAEGRSSVD